MEVSEAYSLQAIGNQVQKNKVQMKKLRQDAQKCRDVWHDSDNALWFSLHNYRNFTSQIRNFLQLIRS